MNENTTFEQFEKSCRTVRFEDRVQHTGSFRHTRSCGFRYYAFVCPITLETFNPFTKKHEGRPYKSFFSSISAKHAKEQAYEYILSQIK